MKCGWREGAPASQHAGLGTADWLRGTLRGHTGDTNHQRIPADGPRLPLQGHPSVLDGDRRGWEIE